MKKYTKEELDTILENHKHWLNEDCGNWVNLRADLSGANLSDANLSDADLSGANLSDADLSGANLSDADLSGANLIRADLSGANLSDADLSGANLIRADLSGANLSDADLSGANLSDADLSGANLSDADLSGANLSDAENLLPTVDYLKDNFEITPDGIIAYKVFNGSYNPPEKWVIQSGSIISENCNSNRADVCGCGINVAPLEWVKKNYKGDIWKILIRWEWAAGIVVPYNTGGKIRCERAELVEIVEREEMRDEE